MRRGLAPPSTLEQDRLWLWICDVRKIAIITNQQRSFIYVTILNATEKITTNLNNNFWRVDFLPMQKTP